jgi:hypothetical protein
MLAETRAMLLRIVGKTVSGVQVSKGVRLVAKSEEERITGDGGKRASDGREEFFVHWPD